MTPQYFDQKDVAESVVLTFDFASELAAGEVLQGAITRTVTVISGTDATPSAMWNNVAQFDEAYKSVVQGVTGGTAGVQYKFKMTVGTSNLLKTLTRVGILPVVTA